MLLFKRVNQLADLRQSGCNLGNNTDFDSDRRKRFRIACNALIFI